MEDIWKRGHFKFLLCYHSSHGREDFHLLLLYRTTWSNSKTIPSLRGGFDVALVSMDGVEHLYKCFGVLADAQDKAGEVRQVTMDQ